MRLTRSVQSGAAAVAVAIGLMTATAAVSIAAPPAAAPAAAAPRPVVSKLSLTSGPVAGGVRVTVTGRYFTKVTKVVFGSSAGKSLKVLSGTKLEVTAPGHSAGTVNVEVAAKAGTSKAVAADRFTYVAAPVIGKVSPAQGPVKGGTRVTITGSHFIRVTKVTFGGKKAKIGAPSSRGSLTVTAPAGTAGQVDIRVSTAYGTSRVAKADHYKYVAPPVVTVAVSPGGTFLGYHATPLYSWVHVAIAGFPADSAVNYTCTTNSSFYQGTAGTTYAADAAGATVQTDDRGSASFDSAYVLATPGSVTCTSRQRLRYRRIVVSRALAGRQREHHPGRASPRRVLRFHVRHVQLRTLRGYQFPGEFHRGLRLHRQSVGGGRDQRHKLCRRHSGDGCQRICILRRFASFPLGVLRAPNC